MSVEPLINGPAGGYSVGPYREVALPPSLARVGLVAWSYRRPAAVGEAAPSPSWRHRVVPDTGVSFGVESLESAGGAEEGFRLVVMGPIHRARDWDPRPGSRLGGVRLRPEWCRSLLGLDPGEHVDAVDDPTPGHRELAALRDRLAASAPDDRLAVLVRWLGARAETATAPRSARLAAGFLGELHRAPARPLDLGARARALGVTPRHLRRVVCSTTGTAPKQFHRIGRLQLALSLAETRGHAGRRVAWSRVAVAAGYYDQAHLIGDFRALAGSTPTDLLAGRLAQPGSMSASSKTPSA